MSPDDTFRFYDEEDDDPSCRDEFVEDEELVEEDEFLTDSELAAIFDNQFIGPPAYEDWLNYSGDINRPHHGSV